MRVFACASALQNHIDKICDGKYDVEVPLVSVSMCQFATVIEVSDFLIWDSEDCENELTPDHLIELFTNECKNWSRFII